MHSQTLNTVRDVQSSADWYHECLGPARGHGGPDHEQLVCEGELIPHLHGMEPDEKHEALLETDEVPEKGC